MHRAQVHADDAQIDVGRASIRGRRAATSAAAPSGCFERHATQKRRAIDLDARRWTSCPLPAPAARRRPAGRPPAARRDADARALITAAIALFAADAAALDVVGQQAEHHARRAERLLLRPVGRATSVRYGCPSRSPRRNITRSPGGLDVHRPADHLDQLLTQRDKVRSDRRILVIAERPRMQPGHVKAVESKQRERVAADQRQVEVARARRRRRRTAAPSLQRIPVTALPRKTAPTPSGIASRITSQKPRETLLITAEDQVGRRFAASPARRGRRSFGNFQASGFGHVALPVDL